MKAKYIIGGTIVISSVIFGAMSFQGSITPYVNFSEAKASTGRCQVMGDIVHDEVAYETSSQNLLFTIVNEEGQTLPVAYEGIMPGNFEQATQVVAKGTFVGRRFEADELLVKCPSKYQEDET